MQKIFIKKSGNKNTYFRDGQQFTFTNSLIATPQTSNNASFINGFSTQKFMSETLFNDQNPHYLQNKQNHALIFDCDDFRPRSSNKNLNLNESKPKFKRPLQNSYNPRQNNERLSFNIKIDLSKNAVQRQRQMSKTPKSISSSLKKFEISEPKQQNIKVYIRLKPKNVSEGQKSFVNVLNNTTMKIEDSYYCFDQIFTNEITQEAIFNKVGRQICNRIFEGYNGTIFAYGQTGSGKTYTIFGEDVDKNANGLIFRCLNKIIANKNNSKNNVKIKCSMVELYKEELIDMFAGERELKLKESKSCGVYVDGLKEVEIKNQHQIMSLVKQASKSRKVTATKVNQNSSRSHTILNIYIQTDKFTSKLCLIDLAGSQKVSKSETKGATLEETKKINYSLSCIGNVINALTTRKKSDHIPFRDSKLTRILKDSLTGNFMTSIIVNCSLSQNSISETISSLKFAERAKKIKVNIQNLEESNQSVSSNSINELQTIIKKLQHDLQITTKELKKYKQSEGSSKQSHDQDFIVPQQSDLSARIPIPSERANVDEKIKKYRKQNNLGKTNVLGFNIHDFSSLNVSKSMKKFQDSPDISSLSYKYDESPDLSLSFSIQGQSAQRKLFFN